jgi:hypothetical protein
MTAAEADSGFGPTPDVRCVELLQRTFVGLEPFSPDGFCCCNAKLEIQHGRTPS